MQAPNAPVIANISSTIFCIRIQVDCPPLASIHAATTAIRPKGFISD